MYMSNEQNCVFLCLIYIKLSNKLGHIYIKSIIYEKNLDINILIIKFVFRNTKKIDSYGNGKYNSYSQSFQGAGRFHRESAVA